MKKSIEYGHVIYHFFDTENDKISIFKNGNHLFFGNDNIKELILGLNQQTARDLIKVLQEFADTGELK